MTRKGGTSGKGSREKKSSRGDGFGASAQGLKRGKKNTVPHVAINEGGGARRGWAGPASLNRLQGKKPCGRGVGEFLSGGKKNRPEKKVSGSQNGEIGISYPCLSPMEKKIVPCRATSGKGEGERKARGKGGMFSGKNEKCVEEWWTSLRNGV